jgi:DUF1365 family protein
LDGDEPIARPLPTRRTTKQNKRTQISMHLVGFESTIPVFEQAKKVHALECASTVTGNMFNLLSYYYCYDDAEYIIIIIVIIIIITIAI